MAAVATPAAARTSCNACTMRQWSLSVKTPGPKVMTSPEMIQQHDVTGDSPSSSLKVSEPTSPTISDSNKTKLAGYGWHAPVHRPAALLGQSTSVVFYDVKFCDASLATTCMVGALKRQL